MPKQAEEIAIVSEHQIQDRIHTIRGMQVMLDRDLAMLYGVETKHINQAVKNNQDKFQEDFFFELSDDEFTVLRSKDLTTNFSKTRTNPKVFTEQGIYMLATILKSKTASQTTVFIIKTFASMRKFILNNASLFQRLDSLETKQLQHKLETEERFNKLFNAIESNDVKPKQGIFFDGQIFDAYVFMSSLIKEAKKSIVLIDNYIDETTLVHLSGKASKDVKIAILTKSISKAVRLDLNKHNEQYISIVIKTLKHSHDRFLLIDEKIYHLGASLKDLGKKWFAFSLIEEDVFELKKRVKEALDGR
jgi:hypothetical protein